MVGNGLGNGNERRWSSGPVTGLPQVEHPSVDFVSVARLGNPETIYGKSDFVDEAFARAFHEHRASLHLYVKEALDPKSPLKSPAVVQAMAIVEKAFEGQFRKLPLSLRNGSITAEPKVHHAYEVAALLAEAVREVNPALSATECDDLIIAGLGHDLIEDCGWTAEQVEEAFGREVARIVVALTHTDKSIPWFARNGEAIGTVRDADWKVRAVACANQISNMEASTQWMALGFRLAHVLAKSQVDPQPTNKEPENPSLVYYKNYLKYREYEGCWMSLPPGLSGAFENALAFFAEVGERIEGKAMFAVGSSEPAATLQIPQGVVLNDPSNPDTTTPN